MAPIFGEIRDLDPGWVPGWSQGVQKYGFGSVLGCHLGGFGMSFVYFAVLVDGRIP